MKATATDLRGSLALVFLLGLTLVGCHVSGDWTVRLQAVTEELQPPSEPASMRIVRSAGADELLEDPRAPGESGPKQSDAKSERGIEVQLQRPLRWDTLYSRVDEPAGWALLTGAASIGAVVTDGTNMDKRSSAAAGARLTAHGRTITLYAQTLRDCLYHAVSGEATGLLHLSMSARESVHIRCDTFGGIDHWSTGAGERGYVDRDPPPRGVLHHGRIYIPQDRGAGTLIVEVHPKWQAGLRLASAKPNEQARPRPPEGAGSEVTIEIVPDANGASLPPPFALIARGTQIVSQPLPRSFTVCVRNHTGSAVHGHISFRATCFNDTDRQHDLFKRSLPYTTQQQLWLKWIERWGVRSGQAGENSGDISRNASIGATITFSREAKLPPA